MTATAAHRPKRQDGEITRLFSRLASRVLLPAVIVVAVLVVLAYSVFPTRTWLDQNSQISRLEVRLAELEVANTELEAKREALGTEAEIERIARQDHGLIRPGEEAFAVLPPAPEPVRLPQAWPFTELASKLDP